MAKQRKDRDPKPKRDKVWVCRGCCCGTRKKHPGVDHKALERAARAGAATAGARYEVTDCLGPCGQGNIVVVRSGGTTRWFRRMNDLASTVALMASVGRDGVPGELERHLMRSRTGKKP